MAGKMKTTETKLEQLFKLCSELLKKLSSNCAEDLSKDDIMTFSPTTVFFDGQFPYMSPVQGMISDILSTS